MRKILCAFLLATLLAGTTALLGGATEDLRIERKEDEERNTVYLLTNIGDRPIAAEVEMLKECTSTEKKPVVRKFLVPAGKSIRLARAWSETSCRHSYRVRSAEYH